MKPDLDRFLEVASAHVLMRTAPATGGGYEQGSTMVLGLLLTQLREEVDRAAARRVEENRELRRLFAEAASAGGAVEDPALRERLAASAAGEDTDLAVSALERSNALLRALLIDLHAHVETLESAAARRVEAAIWRELVASTERRKLSMGPY